MFLNVDFRKSGEKNIRENFESERNLKNKKSLEKNYCLN